MSHISMIIPVHSDLDPWVTLYIGNVFVYIHKMSPRGIRNNKYKSDINIEQVM